VTCRFLAFEIRYGFNGRALWDNDLSLSNLGREHDLDRHAVGGNTDGIGRGRGEGNVDGVRDDRAGWAVDLRKLDPFDVKAFLFGEFQLLHDGAESQAEATGPVADLYLLRK
jgi:hypothetical protein